MPVFLLIRPDLSFNAGKAAVFIHFKAGCRPLTSSGSSKDGGQLK